VDEALRRKLEGVLTPEELALLDREAAAAASKPGRKAGAKSGGRYGEGSVYRDKASGNWIAALYVGGVQRTWSCGTQKKADAVALLAEKREAARRGGIMRDVEASEIFNDCLADYKARGHATVHNAEQRFRAYLGPFFSCRDDEGDFKRRRLAEGATEPQVEEELRLRRLRGDTKFTGGVLARSITNADAQRYLLKRRADGVADATVANEMALLRRALNLALRNRKLDLPAYVAVPGCDNARQGFLEPAQYRLLMQALPEHVQPIACVAYLTGMRRGELIALQWSRVDLRAGLIRLRGEDCKNGKPRTIQLPAEARAALVRRRALLDTLDANFPLVFFRTRRANEKPEPKVLPLGDIDGPWAKACAAVGLAGLLFHDMRRSAVRNMVRSGVPERIAMAISGHKTRSVFDRYDICSEADLAAAAKKVDEYVAPKPARTDSAQSQLPETVN